MKSPLTPVRQWQYADMIFMPPPKSPSLSYIGINVWPYLRKFLERISPNQGGTMSRVL